MGLHLYTLSKYLTYVCGSWSLIHDYSQHISISMNKGVLAADTGKIPACESLQEECVGMLWECVWKRVAWLWRQREFTSYLIIARKYVHNYGY